MAVLIAVTRSVKNQDAAGLGVMAYALANGDRSVLTGTAQDRDVKLMASGIQRPDDFWGWLEDQNRSEIATARAPFRKIGNTLDRAVIKSAAI